MAGRTAIVESGYLYGEVEHANFLLFPLAFQQDLHMSQFERLEQLFTLAGGGKLGELAMAAGIRENTAQEHKDRDSVPFRRACDYVEVARQAGVKASVEWLLNYTSITQSSIGRRCAGQV